MTEFDHSEQQQTNETKHSPLLTNSNMPNLNSSSRNSTLMTKHFTNTDNDNNIDNPHSIYKEECVIEMFQHWKTKKCWIRYCVQGQKI